MAGSSTPGDVYEITVVQDLKGQEVLNIYFYEVTEIWIDTNPTFAQALVEDFVENTLPDILAISTGDLTVSLVKGRNLFNEADSYSLPVSLEGTLYDASADTQTTFNAVGFTLGGETTAVKAGAKRFAGVADAVAVDGVITDGTMLTNCAGASTALERALQVGFLIGSDVAIPVIVKRVRTGTPGNYEYRLPATQAESVQTRIINALFSVLVTSQVSRKIGIGV